MNKQCIAIAWAFLAGSGVAHGCSGWCGGDDLVRAATPPPTPAAQVVTQLPVREGPEQSHRFAEVSLDVQLALVQAVRDKNLVKVTKLLGQKADPTKRFLKGNKCAIDYVTDSAIAKMLVAHCEQNGIKPIQKQEGPSQLTSPVSCTTLCIAFPVGEPTWVGSPKPDSLELPGTCPTARDAGTPSCSRDAQKSCVAEDGK